MVNSRVPSWYQGSPESWEGTAKDSPGIWTARKVKSGRWPWSYKMEMFLEDHIPDEFLNYYVPWPTWKRILPVGAYTSLWPNSRGNDWTKVKPAGFDENWRPTGPAHQESWK